MQIFIGLKKVIDKKFGLKNLSKEFLKMDSNLCIIFLCMQMKKWVRIFKVLGKLFNVLNERPLSETE